MHFKPPWQSEVEQNRFCVLKNKFSRCATEYLCAHVPTQLPSAEISSVHRDGLVKTWTKHRTGHTGKKNYEVLYKVMDIFSVFPGYGN